MAYTIQVNESNASRRVVYLWCVGSNGTSPATGETGGQPQYSAGGVFKGNTSATLSAASAAAGEYFVTLTASEVSLIGPMIVRYNSANALETVTPVQVVGYDSSDSMRLGLFAMPNAAANAVSGLPVIGNDYSSTFTVGVSKIAPNTYSGVTVGTGSITPATYSGVTVGVGTIAAAIYSGVTVGANPVGDKTGYTATITAGDYSSTVTFGTGSVNVASGQSIADRVLSRSIGTGADGGRTVSSALFLLRNKVDATGSIMTVYSTDDTTSAWTASTATAASPLGRVDPT